MRYLKLFETIENDDLVIDKDYIEMCFVNFIDKDNFKFMFHAGRQTCEITIDVEDTSYRWEKGSIKEFIEKSKKRNELFNELDEIISKIEIQYPTIKHKIVDRSGADEENITVILSISTRYISHEPDKWFTANLGL